MAHCEDFPCCGHELGCCPDFDEETGEQLNMVCVCGAKLPIDRQYSICDYYMIDPESPDAAEQYAALRGDCCDDPTPAEHEGQRYCESCDSDLPPLEAEDT